MRVELREVLTRNGVRTAYALCLLAGSLGYLCYRG